MASCARGRGPSPQQCGSLACPAREPPPPRHEQGAPSSAKAIVRARAAPARHGRVGRRQSDVSSVDGLVEQSNRSIPKARRHDAARRIAADQVPAWAMCSTSLRQRSVLAVQQVPFCEVRARSCGRSHWAPMGTKVVRKTAAGPEQDDGRRTKAADCRESWSGRYWARTSDLLLVRAEPPDALKPGITGFASRHVARRAVAASSDVLGCLWMCSDAGTRIRLVPIASG
jgi:hypothetical protein